MTGTKARPTWPITLADLERERRAERQRAIEQERDRLKASLARVWAAARDMSLDHPVEAAAIFTAIGDRP